ncbi:PA-phosphatase [Rhodomicrobium udaipurense JA643]|uniref:Phosphatase PAP2 family protein n=1 Tax=Rhodomicrobium udaipurense TaxID=1202716 RepID=A0A8I1GF08_9HYPH|nr:phosphatase PAP2 family protein [Rhodomicrobium udaipurense]KAI96216.1 PA-phosphatase [Rhodomicrobium udaipurense JA643]MBJ7544815.1 phosphatase PAP2 family protein [Rhodomicrobium udaipurense]
MDAVTVEFQARRRACLIRFVAGLGVVAAIVVFGFFFVDRQIAGLLRPQYYGDPFFVALTYIAKPLAPAAAIILALIATRNYLRGGSLTAREDEMLRLSLAIVVSAALAVQLKILFGRTWPETWVNNNPSWFANGVYGFFPLTDSRGFASFPSGHTTVIAALAGAVWRLWPKLRFVGVIATALVGIGLLGATYHWFSDIVAGAVLGFVTGLAAASIGKTQPDAL